MKKFRFTLEKLKDYREQVLQTEKNNLGKLRQELNEIYDEVDELKRVLSIKNDELIALYKKGAVSFEISVHKRFIISVQQEIKVKKQLAIIKEKEIEKQLIVVMEAAKDVKTLDNLEDKQLDEYKKQETKENELFIEEFVANSSYKGED